MKTLFINLINYILLLGATGVGIYYLISNQHLALSNTIVIILIVALVMVCLATFIIIQYLNKKEKTQKIVSVLILSVLLVEILVYVGLTPIWIYGLYGIPSIVSIISRVLRMVFLIPVKVLILLAILKTATKGENLL